MKNVSLWDGGKKNQVEVYNWCDMLGVRRWLLGIYIFFLFFFVCAYVFMCTCVCLFVCVCLYVCVCVCFYVWVRVCMKRWGLVDVYICVFIGVLVFIYVTTYCMNGNYELNHKITCNLNRKEMESSLAGAGQSTHIKEIIHEEVQ